MKINHSIILLVLIFISCGTNKKINYKTENTKEIFRHVNLNFGNKILLKESFDKIKDLTYVLEGNIYVKENLFGFVESIQLLFNEENRLSEVIFEYSKSKSKAELIDSYSEDLGKPVFDSDRAFWEDKKTRFEILYDSRNNKLYSKMIDI